jgi:hypothetical protein
MRAFRKYAATDAVPHDTPWDWLALGQLRAHELLPDRLRSLLANEGADVFTTELLTEAAPNVRDRAGLGEDDFVLFVEPPSFDARIVNQYRCSRSCRGPTGASTTGSPSILTSRGESSCASV